MLSTLLPYVIQLVMLKSFSSPLLGSNFILTRTVVGNQLHFGSVHDILESQAGVHIIPVQLIKCRTLSLVDTFNHASVLFVSLCIDF